jgi:outer membrane protein insertion porin family
VELRVPFANSLQGVLFSDLGDAWGSGLRGNPQLYANYLNWRSHGGDSNGDGIQDPAPLFSTYDAYEYRMPQHTGLELHFSYGAGVRVKTPIGALRLDYGISKEGKRTHFSISQTF